MKLIEFNRNPSHLQLKQFGVVSLFALPLVTWFWGGNATVVASMGLLGTAIAIFSIVSPKAIKPIFLGLTAITTPIGMVLGEVVMLMIYLIAFLPIALLFRLTGRDALLLRVDRNAASYWKKKKPVTDITSYYRQS